jgi:hypothetical protein
VGRNILPPVSGAVYFKLWTWDYSCIPVNTTSFGQDRWIKQMRFGSPSTYRLKLRVLTVFGNHNSFYDWEEWISPPLEVTEPSHDNKTTTRAD